MSANVERLDGEISVKWLLKLKKGIPLLVALPDIGLVGLLTATNAINSNKMPLTAFFESPWIPSAISIVNGKPLSPLRLYSDENLAILLSEVPLSTDLWNSFSDLVSVLWERFSPKVILGAVGLPNQKRHTMDKDKLRVFVSYTKDEVKTEYFESYPDFSGMVVGPYAAMMRKLLLSEADAALLMIDSYPGYPDPEAAAVVTEILSSVIGARIDPSYLIEKGAEIRIMARKLAAEAQKAQSEIQPAGRPAVSFYM